MLGLLFIVVHAFAGWSVLPDLWSSYIVSVTSHGNTALISSRALFEVYSLDRNTSTVGTYDYGGRSGITIGHLAIFAGAYDSRFTPQSDVVLYDFETSQRVESYHMLSNAGEMTNAVVGSMGFFGAGNTVPSHTINIFDANSYSWRVANLSIQRTGFTICSNGQYVFFAGGWQNSVVYSTIDVYNVLTDGWSVKNLGTSRGFLSSASVLHYVLFAGGRTTATVLSKVIEVFDGRNQSLLFTLQLSIAREAIGSATAGLQVLFAGGATSASGYTARVDIVNASTWMVSTYDLRTPRDLIGTTSTRAGKAVFAGGDNSPNFIGDVDMYTGCPNCEDGYEPTPACGCAACPTQCNRCSGGLCYFCNEGFYLVNNTCAACPPRCSWCTNSTTCTRCLGAWPYLGTCDTWTTVNNGFNSEIFLTGVTINNKIYYITLACKIISYDTTTRIFQTVYQLTIPSKQVPCRHIQDVNLHATQNKLWIVGGWRSSDEYGFYLEPIKTIEYYDLSTNRYVITTTPLIQSSIHSLLVDNQIVITVPLTKEVQIYNIDLNGWYRRNVSYARGYDVALCTAGRYAVMAGGPSLDLYDVPGDTLTTIPISPAFNRTACTNSLSYLFLAGGVYANGTNSDNIMIYDINLMQFLPSKKLSLRRYGISASTIGLKVVFAGGRTASTVMSSRVDILNVMTWELTQHSLEMPVAFLVPGVTANGLLTLASGLQHDGTYFQAHFGMDVYHENCYCGSGLEVTASCTCQACPAHCTSCSNGSCLLCQSGYLVENGTCVACSSGCGHCSNTTCFDSALIYCNLSHCADCPVSGGCSQCQSGYVLNNSACVECTIDHCARCSSVAVCATCSGGYYLVSSNQCAACVKGCTTCTTSFNCQQCSPGYYSSIYSSSPCVACSANCAACNSIECVRCAAGYRMYGGTCQDPCGLQLQPYWIIVLCSLLFAVVDIIWNYVSATLKKQQPNYFKFNPYKIAVDVCVVLVFAIYTILHLDANATGWGKYQQFVLKYANSGMVSCTVKVAGYFASTGRTANEDESRTMMYALMLLIGPGFITHTFPFIFVYIWIMIPLIVLMIYTPKLFVRLGCCFDPTAEGPGTVEVNMEDGSVQKVSVAKANAIFMQQNPLLTLFVNFFGNLSYVFLLSAGTTWMFLLYNSVPYMEVFSEDSHMRNTQCFMNSTLHTGITILSYL